jgi:cytochrome b
MSDTIICVCAWAPAEHRLDAFVAALSALTYARDFCRFRRDTRSLGHSALGCTVAEAIFIAEQLYGAGAAIEAFVDAMFNTRRVVPVAAAEARALAFGGGAIVRGTGRHVPPDRRSNCGHARRPAAWSYSAP